MRRCTTAAKTLASSDCGCASFKGAEPRPGGTVTHCLSIYNPSACLGPGTPRRCMSEYSISVQRLVWLKKTRLELQGVHWTHRRVDPRAASGLMDFLLFTCIAVLYNYMDITDVLNLQRFRRLHVLSFQSNFEKISIYIGYILYIEKSPNISF